MWIKDWPEEEGWYWFYGWCWGSEVKDTAPGMRLVENRKISNGFVRITNGHFMYKGEGATGLWKKAELPEPPIVELMQMVGKWRS